ncbi:YolD-like protein [Anoxybacillus vitaminiphilus]|uniref:YolD-like protein n=1 Tax=Paranoxybacillus vitaminiphilus TaxID=581036 RepID=A0A327Y2X8_9BACL|nr:YolD-like family protein [Anoxybacillus vitaminiphilus]RAK15460.1 YolD-like protein [Anoxybacillus vitaminiphilus]
MRDRGNIKWTGFLIPEHREMLKHLYEVNQHMVEKPLLDEQKFDELNEVIHKAMAESKPLAKAILFFILSSPYCG